MSLAEIYPKGMMHFCTGSTQQKPGDGDGRLVGIELEIEGLLNLPVPSEDGPQVPMSAHWSLKRDGSLRNSGGEMVSKPIRTREISQVIAELMPFAQSFWDANGRCGTHVHVDVRNLSCQEYKNQVGAYLLLEPVFYDFVGGDREESIYCVPYYRAPKDLARLVQNLDDVDWQSGLIFRHFCKYLGYNMAPAGRFGTVEFRHAPAWKFWDKKNDIKLAAWVKGCSTFVSLASKLSVDEILQTSPAWLIQRLFPDWAGSLNVPQIMNDIEANDCVVAATKLLRGSAPHKFSARTGWTVSKKIPIVPKVAPVHRLDDKYKFLPRGLTQAQVGAPISVSQLVSMQNAFAESIEVQPAQGLQGYLNQLMAEAPSEPEEDLPEPEDFSDDDVSLHW